jgi:hypothetical protein
MDRFQEELQKMLNSLQQCQRERSIESCLSCEKLLECEVRKEYVKAVYKSMSKGTSGGFDF